MSRKKKNNFRNLQDRFEYELESQYRPNNDAEALGDKFERRYLKGSDDEAWGVGSEARTAI